MGLSHRAVKTPDLSDHKLGQLLDNSMSVNVLERILSRALVAAGLQGWDEMQHSWECLATAKRRVSALRA